MASSKDFATALRAAANELGVSGNELGELLACLAAMPLEARKSFPIDGDNEAIISFVRAAAGNAVLRGPGSTSTTDGSLPAAAGTDNSQEYAKRLVQPALGSHPPLDDLERFLTEPPAAEIPITADWLDANTLTSANRLRFVAASGHLADMVRFSVASPLYFADGSEMTTAYMEHVVVVMLLLELDKVLPADLRIGLVMERRKEDSDSLITVKSHDGSSLRPDGVLRDKCGRRLLTKWEDRADDMEATVKDLHKKTAVWTPLYYGKTEYLPCFAAAGSQLQFYAIPRGSGMASAPPRAISPRYDLTYTADRVSAVMATIKFYQLLRAQLACYPVDVLPADAVFCAQGHGFTRELLFRTDTLAVRKRVSPWSAFASWCGVDFKQLKKLYADTAQQQGLVHAVKGTPTLEDDVYTVDIVPVGLPSSDALPVTEDDARRLLHGLLHGLAAIHKAGFVHRDLRWDNFGSCPGDPSSRRWFLLDLETCAPADQEPLEAFEPAGWQSGITLVDGRYTRRSDLYQLGLAVQPKCERVVVSAAGKAFMEAILAPPAMQKYSAEQLLAHEWLRCKGASTCKAAGARPGEC